MSKPAVYVPPAEPTPETITHPVARYLLATRPAFLTVSLVPCFIGLASAYHAGVALNALAAVLTVLGALVVHAGINVLNDYYDAKNGTDALNKDRLFPFTGGSRFIQNGLFSARQTARYGAALLCLACVIGVALALYAGPGLWAIGAVGVFIGWAYSAPPFSLNSRGLGEISVALGFGILIPLGADYVQRGALAWLPFAAGLPYALMVTNVLYINQFPDLRADQAAGKHHWVVRLGPRRARWGYALIAGVSYALIAGEVLWGTLPRFALVALLPALFSFAAARQLLAYAERPPLLANAIRMTIVAALAQGVLLAAAIGLGKW